MKKLLCLFSLIGCFSLFAMDSSSDDDYLTIDTDTSGHMLNNPLVRAAIETRKRKEAEQEQDRKENWLEYLKKDWDDLADFELVSEGKKLIVTFKGKHDLKDPKARQENTESINTIRWLVQRHKSISEPAYFKVTDITFTTELTDPNYFEIIHKSVS